MRDTLAYMLKASHTNDGVYFAWAVSLPLKSILTLVGSGEYSGCMCVKEKLEVGIVSVSSVVQNAKICVNMACFLCMYSLEWSLGQCEQFQGILEGQVSYPTDQPWSQICVKVCLHVHWLLSAAAWLCHYAVIHSFNMFQQQNTENSVAGVSLLIFLH